MDTAPHVVLLNASPDESEMYGFWLGACGYRVTVAQTQAFVRHVIRTETVDVLVIDAVFARPFRRAEFEPRSSDDRTSLAIVVLSGYLTDATLPVRQGVHEVRVFKPCLPHQLSDYIDGLLAGPTHVPIHMDEGKHVDACGPS